MELNNETLEKITRLAAVAYSPKQVAFSLGLKPYDFLKLMMDDNSDVAIAYYKGFYSSELSIRESVMKLARDGSSPAQTLALKHFDETRKTILKNGLTTEEI
jgi:hypothetical protein